MTKPTSAAAFPYIRPLDKVFLVVEVDLMRESIDARRTTVVDVDESKLVLAQTDPRITGDMEGRQVEVAFFPPPDPACPPTVQAPCGFSATILSVRRDYPLGPGRGIQDAVVTTPPAGECRTTAIRMQVRAQVKADHGLHVAVPDMEEAKLMDISGGGVLLSLPKRQDTAKGCSIAFTLFFIDGQSIPLEGEIRWTAPDARPGFILAGVKFRNLAVRNARFLCRMTQRMLSPVAQVVLSPEGETQVQMTEVFGGHGKTQLT